MNTKHLKFKRYFVFCSAIFFCCFFITACCKKRYPQKNNTSYTSGNYSEIPKDTSVILWKNPNATNEEFEIWKQNHHLTNPQSICPFCQDSALELYSGVSIEVFGGKGGNPPPCTGATPPCKPSGGSDDTVYYCYNFPLSIDTTFFKDQKIQYGRDSNEKNVIITYAEPLPSTTNFVVPSQTATGSVVNIGIFDTGVDPSISTEYTTPLSGVCFSAAAKGWNYAGMPVGGNPDTRDDYPGKHGTAVAKFIINEAAFYHQQKINIIPVKIFDVNGHTSLYNILCGFAYAQKSGINIINASFGFYWDDLTHPPVLFTDFVKKSLSDNGILLIAAAGNRDLWEDNSVALPQGDLRNLKKHPCYPAALAGQPGFENVITVTTLLKSQDKVSPQQNFSSSIVDIGIEADQAYTISLPAPTDEFGYKDPLGRNAGGGLLVIAGSSYAAPVITGKIAANYNSLVSGMGSHINKNLLFSRLKSQGLILRSTGAGINAQVKNGMYAVRK